MPDTLTPTDEQLVASYQRSGESNAVDDLFQRHLRRVNNLLYHMLLDESTADDLTQEVFLRALQALPRFRGEARFSTWLYRVALNSSYGHLRAQRRSRLVYQPTVPETKLDGAGPDRSALQVELNEEIRAALAELSPKLRAAIVLTALHDVDVSEAARIEGCTTATMYWRIHQARKQLSGRLAKYLSL